MASCFQCYWTIVATLAFAARRWSLRACPGGAGLIRPLCECRRVLTHLVRQGAQPSCPLQHEEVRFALGRQADVEHVVGRRARCGQHACTDGCPVYRALVVLLWDDVILSPTNTELSGASKRVGVQ